MRKKPRNRLVSGLFSYFLSSGSFMLPINMASAKEKYRKTMEFIRGAATEAFTAECKDFCTIVDESENYQRQLDSLNDFIREAQETQREIGALRMKLAEVLQKQSASTVKD